MTREEIAKGIVNNTVVMDKELINIQGLTKEDVKAIRELVKGYKAEAKAKAFRASNCVVSYKGKEMAFNPAKIEGYDIIIWKTLDKNAIVYAKSGKNGEVVVDATANCVATNQAFELRKAQVSANKSKDCQLISDITSTMTFVEFVAICEKYPTFKEVKATGALKRVAGIKEEKKSSVKKVVKGKKSVKKTA